MSAASAQAQRPTLAVMPAQYFSADAESAHAVTNELVYQFGRRGYSVVPRDQSRAAFAAMKLQPNRPYSDRVAAQFGRQVGADLVVYPQLLSIGLTYGSAALAADAGRSGAVLQLAVVNAHTGRRLYTRQVKEPFQARTGRESRAPVSRQLAGALASSTSGLYFERVAGSRQEIGRRP
jgi:hypothetical protein